MKKNLPFKLPKIVRGKDWYVSYQFINPNTLRFEEKKVRSGINYIKDLNEKERAAEEVRKQVLAWLKDGKGPFIIEKEIDSHIEAEFQKVEKVIEKRTKKGWTIKRAIDEFRKFTLNHGYAKRTQTTYKSYVDDLEDWLTEENKLDIIAAEITEYDVKEFLDDMSDDRDWEERTYNNNFEFYSTFFKRCNKLEKEQTRQRGLKYDFDFENIDLKITKPQVNKPYTPLLAQKIKKELARKGNEGINDYIQWIYYSLMRPREIRALKVMDIDVISRHIRIIGKTGDRLIPISDQLMALIEKRGVMKMTPETYVFGYAGQPNEAGMSVDYFLENTR